jgi:uncharacterized membrane-anchored protein
MNPLIFWISLLFILLFGGGLAAALLQDSGYVWMIWQGFEIQSSVAILMISVVLMWLCLTLFGLLLSQVWQWPKRDRQRESRQQLKAQQVVLSELVLALQIGDQATASQLRRRLSTSPRHQLIQQIEMPTLLPNDESHHDVAVLRRAQAALANHQYDSAQPLLNCLQHWPAHPEQDQLTTTLRQAYTQHFYAQWAIAQPWQVLLAQIFVAKLNLEQWKSWLDALYQQLDEANDAAWAALLDLFDQQRPEERAALASAWLRLLAERSEGQTRAVELGIEIFQQQFCPSILYDWLRSARSLIEPVQIAPLLNELQTRYVGQPALQLAQAYWCAVQHDQQQAEQWVLAWPNAVLQHRLQALLSLDQLARPSRLAAPLFVFDVIEAER